MKLRKWSTRWSTIRVKIDNPSSEVKFILPDSRVDSNPHQQCQKKKKSSIFKSNLYILFIFDKFHPRLLRLDWSWHIIIPHVVNYLIVDALGSHLISCKDCAALSRNCIVLMSLSLSLLEWRSYSFLSPLPSFSNTKRTISAFESSG